MGSRDRNRDHPWWSAPLWQSSRIPIVPRSSARFPPPTPAARRLKSSASRPFGRLPSTHRHRWASTSRTLRNCCRARAQKNPSVAGVKAAKYDQFRQFLATAIAKGPLEVTMAGDLRVGAATRSVAETFGALPTRSGEFKKRGAAFQLGPLVVLSHQGKVAQRGLRHARSVFRQTRGAAHSRRHHARLAQRLRERAGTSYSMNVNADVGRIVGSADLPPGNARLFFEWLATITAALRDRGPTRNELDRARNPLIGTRASQINNNYWLDILSSLQREPPMAAIHRDWLPGLEKVRADDVQAAARQLGRCGSYSCARLDKIVSRATAWTPGLPFGARYAF